MESIDWIVIAQAPVYAAVAFAWLFCAKLLSDRQVRATYDSRKAIEEDSNLAVALRSGGLYVGLAIGMLGALAGGSGGVDFRGDLLELAIDGGLITAFLFIAQRVTDTAVIRQLSTTEALRDGNLAVGLVEFGTYVATGLIAYGSFAGEGGGQLSSLVFFALGQVALMAVAVVYEHLTPFRVMSSIRAGNPAAGLMLGGMLVAFALILNASLLGPAVSWTADLTGFGLSAVMGIALLALLQWPIDRLFLPGTTLRQEIEVDANAAAILVAVSVKLALALVIGAVLV